MDKTSYGERVRVLREDKAMSQRELAEAAATTTNTVGRIERGEVYPRPSTQRRLAEVLGVTPRYLRRGEE